MNGSLDDFEGWSNWPPVLDVHDVGHWMISRIPAFRGYGTDIYSQTPSPGGANEEWLCLHRGIVFTSERMSVGYALMDDRGVWRTKVWSSTTGQHELAFIETLSRSCLNFVLQLYIAFASCLMLLYDEIGSWLKPESIHWGPLPLTIMHCLGSSLTRRQRDQNRRDIVVNLYTMDLSVLL